MREYKFRAWDNENNQMLDVQELNFEDCFYGGEMQIKTTMYNDYFDCREMPLMQYTGLHDKNGKEIYEGDILQIDIERAWVMWNEKYGYFELVPIGDYYFDSPVTGQAIEYTDATVIGNIYENKELLNETNR